MKKQVIVFVLALVVAVGTLPPTAWAKPLDRATIKVRVHVPVFQDLTVIDPVAVPITYPWDGAEEGKALVIRNVGRVRVRSNADWAMQVAALDAEGLRVSVKPSNDPRASWQVVSQASGVFAGTHGSHELSWDIRVEAPRNASIASRQRDPSNTFSQQNIVQLMFTLGQH